MKHINRRQFFGGAAASLGWLALRAGSEANAQTVAAIPGGGGSADAYDRLTKLCFNENNHGPAESVIQAVTGALKYAGRYGAPDGGIVEAIAAHHGVDPGHILIGSGSTEILQMATAAFLPNREKVLGVAPTFGSVFEFATGMKAGSVQLPLTADHRQDIGAMVEVAQERRDEIGFVYLCNPNNPTGRIVTKREVEALLDGLPKGMPVLVDEAYHHFVDDPDYATSVSHVAAGRPVVVLRTFSKISALAGLRLGYAVAPSALINRLRPHAGRMTVNILAKHAGVAALKDIAAIERERAETIRLRRRTVSELEALGYDVVPSQGNFFMVHLRRQVGPVIRAFRERDVLVGRPFPPMLEHLRVSVGTDEDMVRFMAAFKDVMRA